MTMIDFLQNFALHIAQLSPSDVPLPRKTLSVNSALDPMRYLKRRGDKWHYVRRVPKHLAVMDERGLIQTSLKTRSLDVAQLRRDAAERADDLYWQGLAIEDDVDASLAIYNAARARAVAMGFEYKAMSDLSTSASVEEILRRLDALSDRPSLRDVMALTGNSEEPAFTVRQAMALYLSDIAIADTKGMSAGQIKSWNAKKNFAAQNFIEIIENKPLLDITRADAMKFHKWWLDRVVSKDPKKTVTSNAANRVVGNMRKMFRGYAAHLGLELKNPFDGLSFATRKSLQNKTTPFETDFITDKLLAPGALDGLNEEAAAIFMGLVETGCRPSELCNLSPTNIHLEAPVPYIRIAFQEERILKTEASPRDIPLVGVSLAFLKRFPGGFPRYRDKETNFSAILMKHLRKKKLLPTANHRVYSLRHSFEKRMMEAGIDADFRKLTMGHTLDRPEYGDGGSMEWRREQLLKIALPFDTSIVRR